MAHYVLLGAGFSRNWGGWLASEVFEYLLSTPQISKNRFLADCLWRNQDVGGFESALAEVKSSARADRSLQASVDALEAAVRQMFADMNQGFVLPLDFPDERGANHLERSISRFLTRFDAIFTTNQDILIERQYIDRDVALVSDGRLIASELPGMRPATNEPSWANRTWSPVPERQLQGAANPRVQRYFKLHGSSNWVADDATSLLIMGGSKAHEIGLVPVLRWYFQRFAECLREDGARLLVIGYGFGDAHINDVIIDAINTAALKLFVIGPDGAAIAKARSSLVGHAGYASSPL